MANDNKDIGEIVKKCKILLLDIEGTTTSISFVKEKLFPYAEENVKEFLDSQWDKENVKAAVADLRKQADEDQKGKVEGVVAIPGEDATKEEQIEGLVGNVKWQMSADRKAGPLKKLQGLIWKQGYDNGDIKGHVYDDVPAALDQWRSVDGRKVYIYSSGSVQAQKLLFGQTLAGDLLPKIDGHFDTAIGAKQEAASYTKIVEEIACKSDEVLFLTDILKEAEAARSAGVYAALVSREGNAPLPADVAATFPVLHSFAELTVTNKRKPEHQDEQPAKVAKTDAEEDVKSAKSETETSTKESEVTEKMEVEEVVKTNDKPTSEKKEEIIVEELTNSNDAVGMPVSDIKPIVEEESEDKNEKTDEKETEAMEVENGNAEENGVNGNEPEKVATVVTEIEDVSDKQLGDVAEIIEGLEPVIEEPPTTGEIDELRNVGEVLEKECDEILSKVQDVTNLDSIPVKPMLNTIAEETMETDNTDSNDIVDRILDTELELEMKQCEDIDVNTISDIKGKAEVTAENEDKEVADKNSPLDSKKEKPAEANGVTETKDEKESSNETVTESKKEEHKTVPEKAVAEEKSSVPETVTPVESAETNTKEDKEETKAVAAEEVKAVPAEVKPVEEETAAKEEKPVEQESSATENKPVEEPKSEETAVAVEEVKPVEESKEDVDKVEPKPQVNGKATNGDAKDVEMNGDSKKEDELSSRLAVENGDKVVNGSNGDSRDAENGQGDSKVDREVVDIKVKTVATEVTTEEPHTNPIDQPAEA